MALHNLRMIIVGCPACFDNTPDGRDAHPTKQLKSFCNIVGCPACFDNTPDGRDAHPTKQQLKAFCNYATPNKWGVTQRK
jgi:hypothetical protein